MLKDSLHSFKILCLILSISLLSGCFSKVAKKDGPPNYYVDASKIPDAVPKPEKIAKYGNMSVYYVFGKRYHTLKSGKHYDEVGTASWYGTKFHARRTSSGERYNMLGMTAAHKTLPLPTYVEVTNLENRRKVIVKVNDRGPFESNRIIDLSYVAARKLGMYGRGTALVRVKTIDPYHYQRSFWLAKNQPVFHLATNKKSLSYTPKAKHSLLYLQVATFRNKANAERLKRRLISLLTTPVNINHVPHKKHFQVQIGPIKDSAMINKITNRLKHFGINMVTSHQIHIPAWDPMHKNGL